MCQGPRWCQPCGRGGRRPPLRSGHLDRKALFRLQNQPACAGILKMHSGEMAIEEGVNWTELTCSAGEFGGAQWEGICDEACMIVVRSGRTKVSHEHDVDAIVVVHDKKKATVSSRKRIVRCCPLCAN